MLDSKNSTWTVSMMGSLINRLQYHIPRFTSAAVFYE
jgi:hypothetical protein